MNYTLQIDLQGAKEAGASLEDLLSKINNLEGGKFRPDALSMTDQEAEDYVEQFYEVGEKSGNALKKGVKDTFSAGGGIASIIMGPASMKELESQFDGLFNTAEAKLEAMGRRTQEKMAAHIAKQNAMVDNAYYSQLFKQTHEAPGNKVDREWWLENFPPILPIKTKTMKGYGMADLPKLFNKMGGWALPQVELPKKQTYFEMDKSKMAQGVLAAFFNPWAGSRIISEALPHGTKNGGEMGIFGPGGAMKFVEIYNVINLVKKAFDILRETLVKVNEQYDNALKIFARQMQTGFSAQFAVRQSMIAEVLGVNENDVFNMGQAYEYLNKKLEFAQKQVASTAGEMATVGMEFGVLKQDMNALWNQLAHEAVPAVMLLTKSLTTLSEKIGKSNLIHNILDGSDGIQKMREMLEKIHLHLPLTFGERFKKWMLSQFESGPGASSFMKQLPASSWEKMGLVVGGGAKTTNQLLAESNKYLFRIAKAVTGEMPNGSGHNFSLSPLTANP